MQKWEIGKTYQLVDYQGFVNDDYTNNNKIYNKVGYSEFKVVDINAIGSVVHIATNNYDYIANIFKDEDLQYFKLVDSLPEIKSSPDEFVITWLDKLQYVYNNYDYIQTFDYADMTLGFRNAPYIKGSKSVVEFINTKYDKLMDIKANHQQLQSKREQLLAELAEIDKQLNIK